MDKIIREVEKSDLLSCWRTDVQLVTSSGQQFPIQEVCDETATTESKKCPGSGKRWAQLLLRVFGEDVLSCPRCESRMQLISFITERKAIVDILESLQMATAPPEIARACRTARQDEFDFA
ncbi:MAG: hypothetical protein WCK49_05205 [Myxococcaceae bacterium]